MKYLPYFALFLVIVSGAMLLSQPNKEDTENVTGRFTNRNSDGFFGNFISAKPVINKTVENKNTLASDWSGDLLQTEIADLTFMQEEEKLARDVYQVLGETWGLQIFSNIANSESSHMEAVGTLIEKYAIDSLPLRDSGKFNASELQLLYEDLVKKGKTSLVDALEVGATIEDLDIKDLRDAIARTDNGDIRLVFQNLERGSNNHLRAFNRQLVSQTGENYTPQFISDTLFQEIIGSTNNNRGSMGLNSDRRGRGQGR